MARDARHVRAPDDRRAARGEVDQAHILKILEPIWLLKSATAVRLRSRIENIMDAATARGQRTGENPARWRGHLDTLLARPSRVHRVQHLAAMPYVELPAFLAELRQQPGAAARALEFLILTACRTSEVTGCRWDEIADDVWVVPASRMKAGKEHRVPLAPAALEIIDQMRESASGPYVFPGRRRGATLSDKSMSVVMHRLGRDCTVHGMRSAFRDWAGERTGFPVKSARRRWHISSRTAPKLHTLVATSRKAPAVDGRLGALLHHAGAGEGRGPGARQVMPASHSTA